MVRDHFRYWNRPNPRIPAPSIRSDAAGHSYRLYTQIVSAWIEIEAAFAEMRVVPRLVERSRAGLKSIKGVGDREVVIIYQCCPNVEENANLYLVSG